MATPPLAIIYLRLLIARANFTVAFCEFVCYAYLKKNKQQKREKHGGKTMIILAIIATIVYIPLGVIAKLTKDYM